jgi:hypothetical protein
VALAVVNIAATTTLYMGRTSHIAGTGWVALTTRVLVRVVDAMSVLGK